MATGPGQVWSWDITYLPAAVRGTFYYLYLFLDLWSRYIVAANVHAVESTELASETLSQACVEQGVAQRGLVLHSDNGSPMKGATMQATMQWLGVDPSYSRPRVSNDNPYSESLFGTLKGRPEYPPERFESQAQAQQWVDDFVQWYHLEHRHSALGMVTPAQRHSGEDAALRQARRAVYEQARQRHPERWSRGVTRDWDIPAEVFLNPRSQAGSKDKKKRNET